MPLWQESNTNKGTKTTSNAALVKIGSGKKIPTLEDLQPIKQAFVNAGTVKQSDITSENVRQTFHQAGEFAGMNAKLGVLLKGKQQVRQQALKTVSLVLQNNAGNIRSESQLQQVVARYAESNAQQLLSMDAVGAQHQGFRVYMADEVDQLTQGW